MMCATVPSGQVQIKSLNKGASSVIKVGKEPNFTPPATERQVSQRAGTACSCFPCPAARADQTCLFVRLQRERVSAGWCLFSHGSTRRFCFPPRGVQHFHPRRSKLPTLCETCRGRKAAAETICLTLTPGFLPCTRLWGLFMPVVLAWSRLSVCRAGRRRLMVFYRGIGAGGRYLRDILTARLMVSSLDG